MLWGARCRPRQVTYRCGRRHRREPQPEIPVGELMKRSSGRRSRPATPGAPGRPSPAGNDIATKEEPRDVRRVGRLDRHLEHPTLAIGDQRAAVRPARPAGNRRVERRAASTAPRDRRRRGTPPTRRRLPAGHGCAPQRRRGSFVSQHPDAWIASLRESVRHRLRGSVIHHEHLEPNILLRQRGSERPPQQWPAIAGRNHDRHLRRGGRAHIGLRAVRGRERVRLVREREASRRYAPAGGLPELRSPLHGSVSELRDRPRERANRDR